MDSEQKKVGGIGPSPNKVLLHSVEIQEIFCHFTQILREIRTSKTAPDFEVSCKN